MTYKEKIEDFVNLLNMFAKDTMLFPENVDEGLFLLEFTETENQLRIILSFEDKTGRHCIVNKSMSSENVLDEHKKHSFYAQAYLELMRFALFAKDTIGVYKDANDNLINIITIQTLITKGLKVLNQTT